MVTSSGSGAGIKWLPPFAFVHLNPVRAGMVKEEEELESYPWSSLPGYLSMPARRFPWLETEKSYEVCGCPDTAAGRKVFLGLLEKRVDWSDPRKAGARFSQGKEEPELAVYSSLRRGWLFGSQEFREKMLKLLEKGGKKIKKANGYHGSQLNDYGEKRARGIIGAGVKVYGMSLEKLQGEPKGDWKKGLLAAMIQDETTMRLDWISEKLRMGTRAGVCRAAKRAREKWRSDRKMAAAREAIMSALER